MLVQVLNESLTSTTFEYMHAFWNESQNTGSVVSIPLRYTMHSRSRPSFTTTYTSGLIAEGFVELEHSSLLTKCCEVGRFLRRLRLDTVLDRHCPPFPIIKPHNRQCNMPWEPSLSTTSSNIMSFYESATTSILLLVRLSYVEQVQASPCTDYSSTPCSTETAAQPGVFAAGIGLFALVIIICVFMTNRTHGKSVEVVHIQQVNPPHDHSPGTLPPSVPRPVPSHSRAPVPPPPVSGPAFRNVTHVDRPSVPNSARVHQYPPVVQRPSRIRDPSSRLAPINLIPSLPETTVGSAQTLVPRINLQGGQMPEGANNNAGSAPTSTVSPPPSYHS